MFYARVVCIYLIPSPLTLHRTTNSSDDAREVEGRDQKGGPPQSFLPWLIEKFRRYIYPEAKVVEAGAYQKDQREKPFPSSPSRRPPPLAPQATTQSSQWPPQPPQRPRKFVFKSE